MKNKIYKYTLLTSIGCLLVSFISKLLGCNDFDIPIIDNAINNNYTLMVICYLLLFNINNLLCIMIIVKKKLKFKDFILSILIFSLYYLISVFYTFDYIVFITDTLVLWLVAFILTRNKKIAFETIIVIILNAIYQSISLFTKNLSIGIAQETFTTNLILSIDYYMLLVVTALFFNKKGVHIYELVIQFIQWIIHDRRRKSSSINPILPKRNSKEKNVQQNFQEVETSYLVFSIVLALFQILLVGFLCYLVKGTVWNFVFIFGSFIMLRFAFGKSWHAETVIWCTTVAIFIFVSGTKLSLDINISILSCVLVGLLIAFILHILYFYNLKKDYSKLSKEDLKIALYYLDNTEIDILYDYYHRGNINVEEIADKYGYNKMKIYRILNKIKKEQD